MARGGLTRLGGQHFHEQVVRVAVAPVLFGLERADDRVLAGVEVLRRVLAG